MDEDTIEEQAEDDILVTIPDNVALDVGDDTVVTSAAPPDDDESPFHDHSIRGAVYWMAGSTRVA
jgi:hypothetical protein